MIRLLHTADWQIGRIFQAFEPDDAAALFEARFRVVERLAALAREDQVHAVLVAGDVFDSQTVSDKTLRRLFQAMQGFEGPWVLLPGNHDAALAESVWSRAARLGVVPPQVHCVLQPQPLRLAGQLTVLPAPLTQRHTAADLTAWFDAAPSAEGDVRLGLAHGCVQGILAEGIDSANPIAADRAGRARLDYLALGDWHGTRAVDERSWYAGTPETDRFRANDSGQALRVDIAGPGAAPQVQVLATGLHRWRTLEQRFAVASDVELCLQALQALRPHEVLQLQWQGHCDLADYRRLQAALEAARARVRALVCEAQALQVLPTQQDIDALQADGFVGDALATLREQLQGPQAEPARQALLILAQALQPDGPAQQAAGEALPGSAA
ncbi:MAG: DNA repair exonuclease [Rubrivivax sp.]|nr:DNA repair exonuclease [Rubrivivax sp.]